MSIEFCSLEQDLAASVCGIVKQCSKCLDIVLRESHAELHPEQSTYTNNPQQDRSTIVPTNGLPGTLGSLPLSTSK